MHFGVHSLQCSWDEDACHLPARKASQNRQRKPFQEIENHTPAESVKYTTFNHMLKIHTWTSTSPSHLPCCHCHTMDQSRCS